MYTNSEDVDKRVAESFEQDPKAYEMEQWSKFCEKLGLVIAVILWVVGLAVAIYNAVIWEDLLASQFSSGFIAFIAGLIPYIIYGLIIYGILKGISMLIGGLGRIVQYNKETARFTQMQTEIMIENNKKGIDEEETLEVDNKKIEFQADINKEDDDKNKSAENENYDEQIKAEFSNNNDGTMTCSECGTVQPQDRNICWKCGRTFQS